VSLGRTYLFSLATRYGWHQRHHRASRQGRIETVEKPNVLVGNKDIDETTEFAGVIEHTCSETGVQCLNGRDCFAHRGGFDDNFASTADENS
jgi:hypothetical protein